MIEVAAPAPIVEIVHVPVAPVNLVIEMIQDTNEQVVLQPTVEIEAVQKVIEIPIEQLDLNASNLRELSGYEKAFDDLQKDGTLNNYLKSLDKK